VCADSATADPIHPRHDSFWYIFYKLMDFEFDAAKSAANLKSTALTSSSAFITMRGDRMRIISVRQARNDEASAYLQD
jgi:uncharacterized DUF497 family protein